MKLKVGVIFGGNSVEHEVSIISASQAMAALDPERYTVIPLYLAKTHELYSGPKLMDIAEFKNLKKLMDKTPQVQLVKQKQKFYCQAVKPTLGSKAIELDLVIPVVHGTHSEDGTVQGYLETVGIPYAGSDVMAAAIGQDKAFMKMAFEKAGLPIVDWIFFNVYDYAKDTNAILTKADTLGFPIVVKPASLGSSVGITLVNDRSQLDEAIKTAFEFDTKVILEKAVNNLRELNCSVFGDLDSVEASVLEEVYKQDAILSYQDKYQGRGKGKSKGMASTSRICPAKTDPTLTEKIQNMAIDSFNALGCAGVTRIDFLMDGETGEVYVNEINTIPGSLSFYLWEASGVTFTQLMDKLVTQAVNRQRQREKMIFSYDTNLLATYSDKGLKSAKR